MTKQKRLDRAQSYKAAQRIEAEGSIKDGFWVYNPDVSDRSIADEFGVDAQTIANLRREVFGKLRKGPGVGRSDVDLRLTSLERRVHILEDAIERMRRARNPASVENGAHISE